MDKLKVPLNATKVIAIFIKLVLILHLVACFWATSANFEIFSNTNWLVERNIQDDNMYSKYMNAFYWAVVTTTTVGYGDIIPVNKFEIGLAVAIIIIGVAYYSYVIANLSFLFASILGEENEIARRKAQIKKFLNVHDYPEEIIDSITLKKEEIEDIIDILPISLKVQILLVLYKDPILKIKLLQNKNTHFIIDYLPKLQPIIVKKGTKIITKETFPTDVFFIYKGSVKNTNNDKIFNDGAVIGETDIIYNREIRIESFIAIKETYLLRLERPVFESLWQEIPEFNDQIVKIAQTREAGRMDQKVNHFIGERQKFIKKKNRMNALINQMEGKKVDMAALVDSELSLSSSDEFEVSSSVSSSSDSNNDDSSKSSPLRQSATTISGDIRKSQSKILDLQKTLRKNTDKKVLKTKTEEEKAYDTNPLDSDNEDNKTDFEGGEVDTPKAKPKKRKRVIRKKKKPAAITKDLDGQISNCLKLMKKAKQMTEEYSNIFNSIKNSFPKDMSMTTRWRVEAEVDGVKLHKNIVNMVAEILESNKLKQNSDILDFHEKKLTSTLIKQKEYNNILDEVSAKVSQGGTSEQLPK